MQHCNQHTFIGDTTLECDAACRWKFQMKTDKQTNWFFPGAANGSVTCFHLTNFSFLLHTICGHLPHTIKMMKTQMKKVSQIKSQ